MQCLARQDHISFLAQSESMHALCAPPPPCNEQAFPCTVNLCSEMSMQPAAAADLAVNNLS